MPVPGPNSSPMHPALLCGVVGLLAGPALGASYSYEAERAALESLRQQSRFDAGMRSGLSAEERRFDAVLTRMKQRELSRRDASGSTLIQQPFSKIRASVLRSPLYKVLSELPKGAVLHGHWDSMMSVDWLVDVATYEENCWMDARSGPSYGMLRFAAKRPGEGYELVSELRKNAARGARAFDDSLKQALVSAPERFEPWGNPWGRFQKYFSITAGLLSYIPVFERYFRSMFRAMVSRTKLVHLELRVDFDMNVYHLNGTTAGTHNALALIGRIAAEFAPQLSVRLILSSYKPGTAPADLPAALHQAARLQAAFPDLVAGFDLVGQEDASPSIHAYAPALLNASLPYFLHAGETANSGTNTAADNLVDAALLARRIGHGTALVKRPELVPVLLRKGIAVEVCPISNQVLGYVQDLRNHPATWMMEQGIAVTLSPDDPGALGYDDVAADWWMALVAWDLDLPSLKQLAYNSLQYSALHDAGKEAALSRWRKQWDAFIQEQLSSAGAHTPSVAEGFVVV